MTTVILNPYLLPSRVSTEAFCPLPLASISPNTESWGNPVYGLPIDFISTSGTNSTADPWHISTDVPGREDKTGWWTSVDSMATATISFRLKMFTSNPIIIVGYLESYNVDMGTVLVYLNGDKTQNATINSYNSTRTSLVNYMRICFPAPSGATDATDATDAAAKTGVHNYCTKDKKYHSRVSIVGNRIFDIAVHGNIMGNLSAADHVEKVETIHFYLLDRFYPNRLRRQRPTTSKNNKFKILSVLTC